MHFELETQGLHYISFFWRAEVATNSWKSNSSLDHDHQDHPYHDHQHHTHHDYQHHPHQDHPHHDHQQHQHHDDDQHHPHHRHLGPLGKPARYCGPALSYSCSGSRLSQHIFTIVLAVLIIIIILIFYTLAPPTIHLNTYSEPFPLKIVLNMTFVDPRKKNHWSKDYDDDELMMMFTDPRSNNNKKYSPIQEPRRQCSGREGALPVRTRCSVIRCLLS